MDQNKFGDLYKKLKHLAIKQAINTPNTLNIDNNNDVIIERVNNSWIDLVFPVTLLTITVLGIVFVTFILVVWLKNSLASDKQMENIDKMSQDLKSIEENRLYDEGSDCHLKQDKFKDSVFDFDKVELISDENISPNIEKTSQNIRRKHVQPESYSPKLNMAGPSNSIKQWILHPVPPLEIKHDVCVQPSLDLLTPKLPSHSPLMSVTPTMFKFEIKTITPKLSPDTSGESTDMFNFNISAANTPKSNEDISSSYYTPRTPYDTSANFYTPSDVKENSPELKELGQTNDNKYQISPKLHSDVNSPRIEDFGNKFTFSPKSCEYYTAKSSSKTTYEHFKFPDPITPEKKCVFDFSNINITIDDAVIDRNIENETKTNEDAHSECLKLDQSSLIYRRSRLKSISLDSDSAKIVEANLGVPVINLVPSNEGTDYHSINNNIMTLENYDLNSDSLDTNDNQSPKRLKKVRNMNRLTINLDHKSESLQNLNQGDEIEMPKTPKTPKTPTFSQTKQKASSLDSCDAFTPLICVPSGLRSAHNSSTSVPSTPKRQPMKLTHKPHLVKGCYYNNLSNLTEKAPDSDPDVAAYEALNSSRSFYSYGRFLGGFTRKMGSFDENMVDLASEGSTQNTKTPMKSEMLGSNLQHFKPSLSVSNTNLKTLPEVMPLSDFQTDEKVTKKSILQRRGSNQSLTLNLESGFKHSSLSLQGSVGNLANSRMLSSSNYSLQAGSSYNISDVTKNKKCLLQRRGSNASLTLNLQKSSNSLNRFNSHSSLNISQDKNRSLLERRNSNTSLMQSLHQSSLGVSNKVMSVSNYNLQGSVCSLASNQSGPNDRKCLLGRRNSNASLSLNIEGSCKATQHQYGVPNVSDFADEDEDSEIFIDNNHQHNRKSLSTESLFHSESRAACCMGQSRFAFGSIDDLKFQQVENTDGSVGNTSQYERYPIRNITTKPLSPQSTSEDFKIYLANIQILQNASNVLCREQLKELNKMFHQGYSRAENQKDSKLKQTTHSSNLFNPPQLPTSELQKSLLRNLHQEFWDLPTNFQEKPLVFGSQTKNRYKTILPNEHSRVVLSTESCNTIDGYINANFIKGFDYSNNAYIVTQGPMQNTIFDFWSMVYQNGRQNNRKHVENDQPPRKHQYHSQAFKKSSQKIIMLTNFIENGRQKCAVYFPVEVGDKNIFHREQKPFENEQSKNNILDDYFTIINVGISNKHGYSVRKLVVCFSDHSDCSCKSNKCDIKNKESLDIDTNNVILNEKTDLNECDNSLIVFHYWFDSWPDHKSPSDVHVLLDMCLHVLENDCELDFTECSQLSLPVTPTLDENATVAAVSPLPIVHCSAGIGRTGCLVAILNGIQQLKSSEKVDILGIVCNMRLNRGGMVQNSEQYELIHKVLCIYEQQFN